MLQRMEDWRKRTTETTEREGTEEQAAWSAGKADKLKPGADKLRLRA